MGARSSLAQRLALLTSAFAVVIGCSRATAPLVVERHADVALTGGASTSMIYLARTADGILAIDLGWWGHRSALTRSLSRLGATPADVRWVFLTHSHRDHLAAWPMLKRPQVFVGMAEQPLLLGSAEYRAWIPRWSERLKPTESPSADSVEIVTFSQDTAFVLGSDTLRAYLVTGHTPGSAVYLFRGVLFLGDAITYTWHGGFAPAKRHVSDDTHEAAESLSRLWPRLPRNGVRYACTAHARCAPFNAKFLKDIAQ